MTAAWWPQPQRHGPLTRRVARDHVDAAFTDHPVLETSELIRALRDQSAPSELLILLQDRLPDGSRFAGPEGVRRHLRDLPAP